MHKLLREDPNQVLAKFVGGSYQPQYICIEEGRLKLSDQSNHLKYNSSETVGSLKDSKESFLYDYPDYKSDWNALHRVISKLKEHDFVLRIQPFNSNESVYALHQNYGRYSFTETANMNDSQEAVYKIVLDAVEYILENAEKN